MNRTGSNLTPIAPRGRISARFETNGDPNRLLSISPLPIRRRNDYRESDQRESAARSKIGNENDQVASEGRCTIERNRSGTPKRRALPIRYLRLGSGRRVLKTRGRHSEPWCEILDTDHRSRSMRLSSAFFPDAISSGKKFDALVSRVGVNIETTRDRWSFGAYNKKEIFTTERGP